MQLFLFFFGLALFGIDVSPWIAAALALTLWTSAFLAEIWRGCVEAIPKGQWEASASLALTFVEQMRYVILPQALRIAIPPTVGFSVQVIKGTALASVIGFVELTKAGTMITNATFRPFLVYSLRRADLFLPVLPAVLVRARQLERPPQCRSLAFATCSKSFGPTRCSRASPSRSAARWSRSSARPARARARCCAASTGWRPIRPARITVDGIEVGGAQDQSARAAPPRRHGVPAVQPVPAPDARPRT